MKFFSNLRCSSCNSARTSLFELTIGLHVADAESSMSAAPDELEALRAEVRRLLSVVRRLEEEKPK